MAVKKMSLKAWIDSTGAEWIAWQLGVSSVSVHQWRRFHCLPKSGQMLQIKKLSKGAVTCDAMIEAFHKAKA